MIKKLLFSAAFFVMMGITAHAQQLFTLEHDTVYTNGTAADFEVVGEVDFMNNTASSLTLRWVRTQNNLTAGWASAVCYLGGTCFAPNVDSATFTMAANAVSGFSFHFSNNNTVGAGVATLMLFQPNNRANAQKVTFIANAYTVGSDDNAPKVGVLSTYPNPAQNILNVKTPENNGTLRLTDVQGRQIFVQNVADTNHQIEMQQLPAGIYVLQFVGKKYRATQRIEKL
jgi:hypothetical protein